MINKKVLSFRLWLSSAKPGSRFYYHEGFLLNDRVRPMTINGITYYTPVGWLVELQEAVWKAYEQDRVSLVQERIGELDYRYIAEKRSEV